MNVKLNVNVQDPETGPESELFKRAVHNVQLRSQIG